MTRKRFEELVDEKGFDEAMSEFDAKEGPYTLTTYELLKERAVELIQEDNIFYALHLLEAIKDTATDEEWYAYDYSAGTFDTPANITTVDDVEDYIGFDEEE